MNESRLERPSRAKPIDDSFFENDAGPSERASPDKPAPSPKSWLRFPNWVARVIPSAQSRFLILLSVLITAPMVAGAVAQFSQHFSLNWANSLTVGDDWLIGGALTLSVMNSFAIGAMFFGQLSRTERLMLGLAILIGLIANLNCRVVLSNGNYYQYQRFKDLFGGFGPNWILIIASLTTTLSCTVFWICSRPLTKTLERVISNRTLCGLLVIASLLPEGLLATWNLDQTVIRIAIYSATSWVLVWLITSFFATAGISWVGYRLKSAGGVVALLAFSTIFHFGVFSLAHTEEWIERNAQFKILGMLLGVLAPIVLIWRSPADYPSVGQNRLNQSKWRRAVWWTSPIWLLLATISFIYSNFDVFAIYHPAIGFQWKNAHSLKRLENYSYLNYLSNSTRNGIRQTTLGLADGSLIPNDFVPDDFETPFLLLTVARLDVDDEISKLPKADLISLESCKLTIKQTEAIVQRYPEHKFHNCVLDGVNLSSGNVINLKNGQWSWLRPFLKPGPRPPANVNLVDPQLDQSDWNAIMEPDDKLGTFISIGENVGDWLESEFPEIADAAQHRRFIPELGFDVPNVEFAYAYWMANYSGDPFPLTIFQTGVADNPMTYSKDPSAIEQLNDRQLFFATSHNHWDDAVVYAMENVKSKNQDARSTLSAMNRIYSWSDSTDSQGLYLTDASALDSIPNSVLESLAEISVGNRDRIHPPCRAQEWSGRIIAAGKPLSIKALYLDGSANLESECFKFLPELEILRIDQLDPDALANLPNLKRLIISGTFSAYDDDLIAIIQASNPNLKEIILTHRADQEIPTTRLNLWKTALPNVEIKGMLENDESLISESLRQHLDKVRREIQKKYQQKLAEKAPDVSH